MNSVNLEDSYAEVVAFGKFGIVNELTLERIGITEELMEASTNLVHALGVPPDVTHMCIDNFLSTTSRIEDINIMQPLHSLFWSNSDFLFALANNSAKDNYDLRNTPALKYLIVDTLIDMVILNESKFLYEESNIETFYSLLDLVAIADELELTEEVEELISIKEITKKVISLEKGGSLLIRNQISKLTVKGTTVNFLTDLADLTLIDSNELVNRFTYLMMSEKNARSESYLMSYKLSTKLVGTIYNNSYLREVVTEVLVDFENRYGMKEKLYPISDKELIGLALENVSDSVKEMYQEKDIKKADKILSSYHRNISPYEHCLANLVKTSTMLPLE